MLENRNGNEASYCNITHRDAASNIALILVADSAEERYYVTCVLCHRSLRTFLKDGHKVSVTNLIHNLQAPESTSKDEKWFSTRKVLRPVGCSVAPLTAKPIHYSAHTLSRASSQVKDVFTPCTFAVCLKGQLKCKLQKNK
jgi:hypothetical protein